MSDVRINIGLLQLPEGGGGTECLTLASEAAAQANASSLAQMKREIAELEAQVGIPRRPSTVLQGGVLITPRPKEGSYGRVHFVAPHLRGLFKFVLSFHLGASASPGPIRSVNLMLCVSIPHS